MVLSFYLNLINFDLLVFFSYVMFLFIVYSIFYKDEYFLEIFVFLVYVNGF